VPYAVIAVIAVIAALVPAALWVGYWTGRRENLTVLDAARQVSEHTRFVVDASNNQAQATDALKDVAGRLDDHAKGLNELGRMQRDFMELQSQLLGLSGDSNKTRRRTTDPDAPQVGE
jgi:hypothetical protein